MEKREREAREKWQIWNKCGQTATVYIKQAAVYEQSVHANNLMMSAYDECEEFRLKMKYLPFEK